MSAEEVLAAFRRDAPNLFLGAAFAAVGTVSLPLPSSDASRLARRFYTRMLSSFFPISCLQWR